MKEKSLHNEFLDILRNNSSKKADMADELSTILNIDKVNIYRRLRGDVKFNIDELGIISHHFGISLDNILGNFPEGPYQATKMKLPVIPGPDNQGAEIFPWSASVFSHNAHLPESSAGLAVNTLPRFLYMYSRHLTDYLRFRGVLSFEPQSRKTLREAGLSDELWAECQEITRIYRDIKKTFVIWDEDVIPGLVKDIHYYHSLGVIGDGDVSLLHDEIAGLLDMIELWAAEGRYHDTGNRFDLYLSSVKIDTTHGFFSAEGAGLYTIAVFYTNVLINSNLEVVESMKDWINNQKTDSVLISKSGAMERREFFKRQREALSQLRL